MFPADFFNLCQGVFKAAALMLEAYMSCRMVEILDSKNQGNIVKIFTIIALVVSGGACIYILQT